MAPGTVPLSFWSGEITKLCAMDGKATVEAPTTVWLAKPEAPHDAESVAVMRWAIEQDAARQGTIAADGLAAAQAAGLSREDTYVFLAYQALLRLEEHHLYLCDVAPYVAEAADSEPSSSGVASRLASHVRHALERVLRPERTAEPADQG